MSSSSSWTRLYLANFQKFLDIIYRRQVEFSQSKTAISITFLKLSETSQFRHLYQHPSRHHTNPETTDPLLVLPVHSRWSLAGWLLMIHRCAAHDGMGNTPCKGNFDLKVLNTLLSSVPSDRQKLNWDESFNRFFLALLTRAACIPSSWLLYFGEEVFFW